MAASIAAPKRQKTKFDMAPRLYGHIIYILKQRIQKKRLNILLEKSLESGFNLSDYFSPAVTHIVSDLTTRDDVVESLKRQHEDSDLWCEDMKILSSNFLSDCIKQKQLIEEDGSYVLPIKEIPAQVEDETSRELKYECQRATPLRHLNHRFTEPLEILAKEAELRQGDNNYSRALAFRRAACCLKSLTAPLVTMAQIRGFVYIGRGHCRRIIQDVLENGFSQEAQHVQESEWFQTMLKLEDIFGVGPKIAADWFRAGVRTVEDVKRRGDLPHQRDERIVYGLAFHRDLTLPVLRCEAEVMRDLVTQEVHKIVPECRVVLTGGFRRGKDSGHDIDLLISPLHENQELCLLQDLLAALARRGLLITGRHTANSYTDTVLRRGENRGTPLRSSLDHFENWMGIVRMDKAVRDNGASVSNSQPSTSRSKMMFKDESYVSKDQAKAVAEGPRAWYARRLDLIVAPADQFYYALVGWTGSKQFNRSLRTLADHEGMKLTSHGLYDFAKNAPQPAQSEEEVFEHLQVTPRDPKFRNC